MLSARRLQNELKEIQDEPLDFCTVELDGDDIFTLNGKFDDGAKFQIKFHEQHPFHPPDALINDKRFCYDEWSPAITAKGFILNMYLFHSDPGLKRREMSRKKLKIIQGDSYQVPESVLEMEHIIEETLRICRSEINANRSTKKTEYLHTQLLNILKEHENFSNLEGKIEQKIPASNWSGTKNCDIVFYEGDTPKVVFPVKMPLKSIKKNSYNYEEQLLGETMTIREANEGLKVIPINIYPMKFEENGREVKLSCERFLHIKTQWFKDAQVIFYEDSDGEIIINYDASEAEYLLKKDD
jgi:ubiquitin-protein ligase